VAIIVSVSVISRRRTLPLPIVSPQPLDFAIGDSGGESLFLDKVDFQHSRKYCQKLLSAWHWRPCGALITTDSVMVACFVC
jgi:hypothetical protein